MDNLQQLLGYEECETIEDLGEKLHNLVEPDPYIIEADDRHIVVTINTSGIGLEFPFQGSEFWTAVDELEDQVLEEIEAEGLNS